MTDTPQLPASLPASAPPSAPVPRPAPAAVPATLPTAGAATLPCANCGTPGSGTFCGQCGQRLDVHLHSVGHFVGEAAEVLTHSDSSLWRTLWPLLARPGHLTREFIAGRRVRYLQPFRLYLVASVLLLVASNLEGGRQHVRAAAAPTRAAPAAAAPATSAPAGEPAAGNGEEEDADGNPLAALREARADVAGTGTGECISTKAAWMKPFVPRLEQACHDLARKNSRELGQALTHNAGRAMFLFLPLLAAFMKLLYWRPKRYYLEHLLLLLHNHAFIYLSFALLALATLLLPWGWMDSLLVTATLLYALRYLYKSMRVYYGQGRVLTIAKFMLLAVAYSVAGAVTFTLAALVTAVTA